ncbi:MAG: sel1 repeat family protein [Clostridium sp.]|nr:sel1 repeat family protein [Prevotella sp.]MCM1429016.1 sel1 repeat family protein [Clostridium sp.]MCM1475454.1 sel1 repeat family protein [Muribaculaceae bacterium]
MKSLLYIITVVASVALASATPPEQSRTALRELSLRADSGDAKALYQLSRLHFYGYDTIPVDTALSLSLLLKSAESGYPPAQNLYGFRLYNGTGIKSDKRAGIDWMEKAAMAGDVTAANNLGWLLLEGTDNRHSDSDAAFWLEKAAAAGMPQAQAMLADLYLQGRGVSRDSTHARNLYNKAIDAGLGDAQLKLLEMDHLRWKELPSKEALALGLNYYTRRAPMLGVILFEQVANDSTAGADASHAHALLGDAMTRALGADYNHDESLRHYFIAARGGNPSAEFILSELLEIFPDALRDINVSPPPTSDEQSAFYWMEKARDAGILNAEEAAKALLR